MGEGQSKLHSWLESCANIAIGFGVAMAAQFVIFPLFDIHVSAASHFGIAGCFTVVSLVRSYLLRRVFNQLMLRKTERA